MRLDGASSIDRRHNSWSRCQKVIRPWNEFSIFASQNACALVICQFLTCHEILGSHCCQGESFDYQPYRTRCLHKESRPTAASRDPSWSRGVRVPSGSLEYS